MPEESRDNRFNEQILRILCLNQAIEKMQKELNVLYDVRASILENFESNDMSDKLADFLAQIRVQSQNNYSRTGAPQGQAQSEFENSKRTALTF